MSLYEVHTIETAPHGSKQLLQNLQSAIGMIPNLAAAMAESPELLSGFPSIRRIFYGGTFSPAEIQVLALTNAFENECDRLVSRAVQLEQWRGYSDGYPYPHRCVIHVGGGFGRHLRQSLLSR